MLRSIRSTMIVALALGLAALPAAAVDVQPATTSNYVETIANAVGPCKGALPAYEQRIRQRPRAVVNESETASSFVNCGFTTEFSGSGSKYLSAQVKNFGNTSRAVNCVAVVGTELDATFYTKTITVGPGNMVQALWHVDQLNGGARWPSHAPLSFQCNLPPLTGLTILRTGFVR